MVKGITHMLPSSFAVCFPCKEITDTRCLLLISQKNMFLSLLHIQYFNKSIELPLTHHIFRVIHNIPAIQLAKNGPQNAQRSLSPMAQHLCCGVRFYPYQGHHLTTQTNQLCQTSPIPAKSPRSINIHYITWSGKRWNKLLGSLILSLPWIIVWNVH